MSCDEYYLTQEYKDYRQSLIQNLHFIESLKNSREDTYGQLFYNEDLRKAYTIWRNLLYIICGILIAIAFGFPFFLYDNTAAVVCCSACYLGILPCLIIASKLSEMNNCMIGRKAFDNYGFKKKLKEYILSDQRHSTYVIKNELASVEFSIRSLTKTISEEMPYCQQKELFKKLKDLHFICTKYDRLN